MIPPRIECFGRLDGILGKLVDMPVPERIHGVLKSVRKAESIPSAYGIIKRIRMS